MGERGRCERPEQRSEQDRETLDTAEVDEVGRTLRLDDVIATGPEGAGDLSFEIGEGPGLVDPGPEADKDVVHRRNLGVWRKGALETVGRDRQSPTEPQGIAQG